MHPSVTGPVALRQVRPGASSGNYRQALAATDGASTTPHSLPSTLLRKGIEKKKTKMRFLGLLLSCTWVFLAGSVGGRQPLGSILPRYPGVQVCRCAGIPGVKVLRSQGTKKFPRAWHLVFKSKLPEH